MDCEVQHVYKNPRYKILTIDGEKHILDMERSFWKIAFPFLFWLFPNSVFKVESKAALEKLKTPAEKQTNTSGMALLGGGIGIVLASLLGPYLMNHLGIKSPPLVNSVIVMIAVILVFLLRFYISNRNKKNLAKVAKFEQLSVHQLWIRPKSSKHFFQVFWIYFFSWEFQ